MKRKFPSLAHVCFALTLSTLLAAHANTEPPTVAVPANQSAPIPMDQLGAVAGKQYQGDGLSVIATPDGAQLRCAFQRLEGHVTREGLWLSSTADNNSGERFRVMAMEVGRANSSAFASLRRDEPCAASDEFGFDDIFRSVAVPGHSDATITDAHEQSTPLLFSMPLRPRTGALRKTGFVTVTDNVARFIRPGLTEEYTVSVDGVRQDFIIEQRPDGDGELRVALDVTGAKTEPLVNGARLVLDGSGRKLAYNRLRVTDATGRELPARMEVPDKSEIRNQKSEIRLAVLVDDAAAIYPVRIDPTFSDADWISMGGIQGANAKVLAAVSDGAGNLYIGGEFTAVGNIVANYVAKWNGSAWSALGAGMNWRVNALALSGTNLFAGGEFAMAGGITANRIARWDGSAWHALASGIGGIGFPSVISLAMTGTNLYVGGAFTTAGGIAANNIAKWDGNIWTSLGSGMSGGQFTSVSALAVMGTNLYAGGFFTNAGGVNANNIAKWNGSVWTALGSGVDGNVYTLAVSGSDLYAGGYFWSAGGNSANYIAKWDGNSWSALGSGMWGGGFNAVSAIAISGTNLYAGGWFATAGDITVNYIAKWDGNSWSSVGNGVNDYYVSALAVVGSSIYAVGNFSAAGGAPALRIAKWDGSSWSSLGDASESGLSVMPLGNRMIKVST